MPKNIDNPFGTGRISEIITELKIRYNVKSVVEISAHQKIEALCIVLQCSPGELDLIIASNPQVFRTVKGHVFEVVFDSLITRSGYKIEEKGGDDDVDRIVNGLTLQLKTPTMSGTKENRVVYKTHKTHGAKSESESFEYYRTKSSFADFLVGLVSYVPLRILFLSRKELPVNPRDKSRIQSPFTVVWDGHPALNAFDRIGIKSIKLNNDHLKLQGKDEILPSSSSRLQIPSNLILNTILRENNFRIWDMNIRGFAREIAFGRVLRKHKITSYRPEISRKSRGDKADIVVMHEKEKKYYFMQIKGASLSICKFRGKDSIVKVETQLTRGRVNDHPTQSRLYLTTDFDYLVVCIDPCISYTFLREVGRPASLMWQYYVLPTKDLATHPKYPRRLKSHQVFRYIDIQKYRLSENWLDLWEKRNDIEVS